LPPPRAAAAAAAAVFQEERSRAEIKGEKRRGGMTHRLEERKGEEEGGEEERMDESPLPCSSSWIWKTPPSNLFFGNFVCKERSFKLLRCFSSPRCIPIPDSPMIPLCRGRRLVTIFIRKQSETKVSASGKVGNLVSSLLSIRLLDIDIGQEMEPQRGEPLTTVVQPMSPSPSAAGPLNAR